MISNNFGLIISAALAWQDKCKYRHLALGHPYCWALPTINILGNMLVQVHPRAVSTHYKHIQQQWIVIKP